MKILLDFIKPICSININLDISSIDFNDSTFKEIDIGLLFTCMTKLSSTYPDPLNYHDNFPNFLIPETSNSLITQNSYLESQLTDITSQLAVLKTENKKCNDQLKTLIEKSEFLSNDNERLKNEKNDFNYKLEESTESSINYIKQTKELKVVLRDKEVERLKYLELSEEYKDKLQKITISFETAKQCLIDKESQLDNTKKLLRKVEDKISKQNNHINELTNEKEAIKDNFRERDNNFSKLNEEYQKNKNMHFEMENTISVQKNEIVSLNSQVIELKLKNEEMEKSLEEMGSQCLNKTLEAHQIKETTELRKINDWIHDKEVDTCQSCHELFTIYIRRHHCRKCGGVFCYQCTTKKVSLISGQKKDQRVCDNCYFILQRIAPDT